MSLAWKQKVIAERNCTVCGSRFEVMANRPDKQTCGRKCAATVGNRAHKRFDPSPDELRSLVWSMPSTEVAKHFGVGDTAIVKRCRSLGIDKPPPGHWNKFFVGKVDGEGNPLNPLIECGCGCGKKILKWGKRGRPRRCEYGHVINHWSGRTGRPGFRHVDVNQLAIRDCSREANDELTLVVHAILTDITYRNYCEYVAPVWLAVSAAWDNGERDGDTLRATAKQAIKRYWREIQGGGFKDRSLDQAKADWGLELAVSYDNR